MKRTTAFWHSSMLVPLCVKQSATAAAVLLYKRHEKVVWWGTPVEIASGLARLRRMGLLNTADWVTATKLADELAEEWGIIQPLDEVRMRAIEIVNRYDLRSADALQLAAALRWCKGRPQGHLFLTLDAKLRDAALLSGFEAPEY